jgi:hypothetical protein
MAPGATGGKRASGFPGWIALRGELSGRLSDNERDGRDNGEGRPRKSP